MFYMNLCTASDSIREYASDTALVITENEPMGKDGNNKFLTVPYDNMEYACCYYYAVGNTLEAAEKRVKQFVDILALNLRNFNSRCEIENDSFYHSVYFINMTTAEVRNIILRMSLLIKGADNLHYSVDGTEIKYTEEDFIEDTDCYDMDFYYDGDFGFGNLKIPYGAELGLKYFPGFRGKVCCDNFLEFCGHKYDYVNFKVLLTDLFDKENINYIKSAEHNGVNPLEYLTYKGVRLSDLEKALDSQIKNSGLYLCKGKLIPFARTVFGGIDDEQNFIHRDINDKFQGELVPMFQVSNKYAERIFKDIIEIINKDLIVDKDFKLYSCFNISFREYMKSVDLYTTDLFPVAENMFGFTTGDTMKTLK